MIWEFSSTATHTFVEKIPTSFIVDPAIEEFKLHHVCYRCMKIHVRTEYDDQEYAMVCTMIRRTVCSVDRVKVCLVESLLGSP